MTPATQRPVHLNLMKIKLPIGGIMSIIHRATGAGCEVIDTELVACDLGEVQAGERLTRVVEYRAPSVTSSLRLDGYVALVSGDFKPVAEYQVWVEP